MTLLSAASGAVDALAFTALGHVFAGVMTGNLALLGIACGGDRFGDVAAPLIALAGYVAGAAAAARFCGTRPDEPGDGWPTRTLAVLAAEAVLLALNAVAWAVGGAPPTGAPREVLLGVAALAMGGQSGAMLGAGTAARPSTYLTGSLTTFVSRAASGGPRETGYWVPVRLGALAVGAGAAAALHRGAAPWAAALPPLLVAAGAVTAARARRERGRPAAAAPQEA
ncbi:DUF1275 family protein [Streptomyces sp. ICBB 8177]|uniref:DUF1275 family protein n=1 Tax=Streptomyces sp. ICBB 8177 TaxID=563922 RepID=UPI000D677CD6|nr:DUF1275 family protein [Streptomyces sp. ICBB 8177]PWI42369.1 DUF1275 family protein [Streptomyces sp. ICBB 8177]